MAHNKDWLPAGQEEFVVWSQKYAAGVNNYAAQLGIPSAVVTTFNTAQATFMAAWNEYVIQEKNPSVNADKRALVNARKAAIRKFHNQYIRYSPFLTDEILAALGAPIGDHTHTHIVVGDRQVVFTLEPKGVFQVEMKCRDKDTGEKKILYGMSGIVAFFAIADAPITDSALLVESALLTDVTHTFHAAPTQRGKWLSATACWQSESGERGDCGAILSAVIP
ncbi:hypothetical protein LQZ19_05650 [Treponema primitia]|uniref:hypothetical protein n=1 Tax=Treponema primitia TaxID=88058 RepID=UPI003980E365